MNPPFTPTDTAYFSSRLCSRASHGKKYILQDWYHCVTCGLTGSNGCCFECAQRCHVGHAVSLHKTNVPFYCDCQDNGKCCSMLPQVNDDTICTYMVSGSTYIQQEWYTCETCALTGSKGCCYVCAVVCHKGHNVKMSVSKPTGGFYCDCGSNQETNIICQSRKKRSISANVAQEVKEDDQPKSKFDNSCIICYEHEKSVVLLPCKHLVCCTNCFSSLRGKCPVDRSPISDKLIVFNSWRKYRKFQFNENETRLVSE